MDFYKPNLKLLYLSMSEIRLAENLDALINMSSIGNQSPFQYFKDRGDCVDNGCWSFFLLKCCCFCCVNNSQHL